MTGTGFVRWPGMNFRAILFCATLANICPAQQVFTLRPKHEGIVLGGAIMLHGTGYLLEKGAIDKAPAMHLGPVSAFDRVATRSWSIPAHRTSNILFGVALGGSLAVAALGPRAEKPLVPVVIILESGLFASGLTNTVKELVRRPRPYLYNDLAPPSAIRGHEDNLSFWSGHTANTASVTFACAALVQGSKASRGVKTVTWIGAAVAPAAMGYLRVRSGRHFPTDVLTGYVVGAAVGLAVPYFHRSH